MTDDGNMTTAFPALNTTAGVKFHNPYTETNISVDKYVTILLFLIGFPGNIICFFVWIQRQMRHSSGVYLAALALTDLVFLCCLVLFDLHIAWNINTLDFKGWCSIFPIFHMSTQYLSPLLVLAFTTERYISICHPFKRERYCTVRRAKLVIAGLVGLTFAFASMQGYFFDMNFDDIDNQTHCSPRASVTKGDMESIYSIYSTVVDLLCFLVGNSAVLILNILVILEMRRLSKIEQTQLQGNSSSQRKSATTFMLLCVSFYQIITTMPVSIAYALFMKYNVEDEYNPAIRDTYVYSHVLVFIKEYGVTHYCFNIFIYLVTGRMFRNQLKIFFLRVIGKSDRHGNTDYSTLRSTLRSSVRPQKNSISSPLANGSKQNFAKPGHNGETTMV